MNRLSEGQAGAAGTRRRDLERLLVWRALPVVVVGGALALAGLHGLASLFVLAAALLIVVERESAITARSADLVAESEGWKDRALRLQTALDSMSAAVIVVNESSRPIIFNPAAETMLGVGPTDEPPAAWSARYGVYRADGETPYPSEELPIVRALRGQAADEPNMLLRNERRDGLWISASARPLHDDFGAARGAVLVCHDMTAHKRAEEEIRRLAADLEERVHERTASLQRANEALAREIRKRDVVAEALRQSQELLEELLERSSAVLYIKDPWSRYLRVSRSYARLFRIDRPGVEGKSDYDVFPKEMADKLVANDRRVLAELRSVQFEEVVLQDGELHTYVSEKFPLFDGQGQVYALCGISTDITEHKQTEAELQRSRASLQALIESTTDAVWSVDREYRLVAMNSAVSDVFEQLFGGRLSAGQNFDERMPSDMLDTWRELYDRALAGERVTTEQRYQNGAGMRHYLISMCPIREAGEITGAVVFSREITDLRRTEELARRNQSELTHVLRLGTMGEISSALAHEINQPLGAIANYAAACGRWLDSGTTSSTDLRRGLELISSEALRAGEIIRRLRDLGRKGSGRMQVIDLNAVVRRASELMEPQVRLLGISLELTVAPDLPRVYADGIQIEQVLLNLILNGVEAMHSSPVKILSVRSEAGDGDVRVCVRDTGSGLDSEVATRVFEPFFTTKTQGLGMGLAISRRIVEAHGGQLSGGPNADGAGSTFCFTLPPSR